MSRVLWSSVLRIAALVALLASAALTVDYLSGDPTFCGAGSGCGDVRRSGFGYVGRVPVPVVGVLAYALVFGLSLGAGGARRVAALLAALGGVVSLGLLALQAAVVGSFCSLCVIVDVAALGAAVAGGALFFRTPGPEPGVEQREPLRAWAWVALGLLALAAPALWPFARPTPDVPEGVRQHYRAGKINVVEFVDFECPFCRLLHPTLKGVVEEYGQRVHFVRLDLPLASHPLARGAARAHVCGKAQGKGDPVADALFEAEDLAEGGLKAVARELGLDMQAFEACLTAPETEAAIVASERILRDADMLQGLPTTFVGGKMLVGAREAAALRDAFEGAARGDEERGVPGSIYVGLLVLLAGLSLWFGRRAPAATSPVSGSARVT